MTVNLKEFSKKTSNLNTILISLCLLFTCRATGLVLFWVYDDAFITFRYARNLAAGYGLVYHPGEWVLGTTAPAFALLTALVYSLGLESAQIVPLTNLLLDAAILVLTMRILLKAQYPIGAAVFGIFYSASPFVTKITVGAMEANLFLLVSLVVIVLYHDGRTFTSCVLAAISYFVRPEAVLLVGLLCLDQFLHHRKVRGILLGCVALATVLPGLVTFQFCYGNFLPQSVLAKSQIAGNELLFVLKQLLGPDPVALLLSLLAVPGVVYCLRRPGPLRTIAAWVCFYLTSYLVSRPHMWAWYSLPTLYGLFLWAAVTANELASYWPSARRALSLERVRIAGGVFAIAICGLLFYRFYPDNVTRRIYVSIEQWCTNNVKPGDTILASDIGVIGYYCNVRIYDTAGLIWPEALTYTSTREMIQDREPTYLFLNATIDVDQMMKLPPLDQRYQAVAYFSKRKRSDLTDIRYSPGWVQEYIMYARRPP